jgi:hypothetical protein
MTYLKSVTSIITIATVLMTPLAAVANSTPNPFLPQGASWIDIPEVDKVYLEDFSNDLDDDVIYSIGAGVSCTRSGVTAIGPFLAGDVIDASRCTKDGSAFDPIDTSGSNRVGAVPIGFNINFFGTTYSDLYFSTNGTVYFDNPEDDYDESVTALALSAESSVIAAMGVDLYYDPEEASIWVGNTKIDDHAAFIISWQEMDPCCESENPDGVASSFQLVFIDYGSGDFVAYINFDDFNITNQGYDPLVWIDMKNGVTVGSNVVTVDTVAGLSSGVCDEVGDSSSYGSKTDFAFRNDANYIKLENVDAKTISVWTDTDCNTPNNVNQIQGNSTGPSYLGLSPTSLNSFDAAAIGWATYNSTTGAVDSTEIFANIDIGTLSNGRSNELRSYSLNTTVPGRIVIGQVGGRTVSENLGSVFQIGSTTAPTPSYTGPLPTSYSKAKAVPGDEIIISGLRLGVVTGLILDGIELDFVYDESDQTILFRVPAGLGAGIKDLVFTSSTGTVTAQDAFTITLASVAANEKVNTGSFKHFVGVYILGHKGSTLSWKIAGKWFKTTITSDYQVFQRRTIDVRVGVKVDIYLDAVKKLSTVVTTR